MPRKRTTMKKIREVLRLKATTEFSDRQVGFDDVVDVGDAPAPPAAIATVQPDSKSARPALAGESSVGGMSS